MKFSATYLCGLLALLAFSSCDKNEEVIPEPEPVDKTVVFEVFGNQDFSYSQYGEEEITFQLVISRKDKEATDALETTVFDSTFVMAIKDIPVRANRMVIKKTVAAVLDEKENVFVGSGYNYRQQTFGKNQSFPANQVEKTFQLIVY
ncbi:hypothetical protein [Pontibacter sp. BAB1700]|uniref:hypothetical protein n=1 Tax=Pontibacter sp. BAB1700 TaxID=1144253 RepID=UPI00026BD533|nr:hypothetical protein [Pontibacter sp. BAB1700]EJF11849.1 hypothetical protein O71_00562 [Pontibacter sp. BAB1700]